MITNKSIKKTAIKFEESFAESEYYNSQTQDSNHVSLILQQLKIQPGQKILDLGTGSGYLAFEIAKLNPQCNTIGLDIVEKTITRNNSIVKDNDLKNLKFTYYDGEIFPYDTDFFDIIVCRYALHHFPQIEMCFSELSRVLKTNGQLYISDPTPKIFDNDRFIDKYMQMKDDGHICFYTKDELIQIAKSYSFDLENDLDSMTRIRFPRKEALKYSELISSTTSDIINAYEVEILGDEVFITEDVLNLSFTKRSLTSNIK
jgi:ubiquinone/menaquinone biosynthesis C-methylase UbiE